MIRPLVRLAIVVEGRTEEEFVKRQLADHLAEHDVLVSAILLGTGRRDRRGGNVTVERIVNRMAQLSGDFDALTTLVDFYGFGRRPTDDVAELEQRIDEAYANRQHSQLRSDRVFAYVQRHEFEALLFSDVRAFEQTLLASPEAVAALSSVRAGFVTPEDIDDSPDAAPSKRIVGAVPRYKKVADGLDVALAVGIEAMRSECPRFGAWLARLEALGGSA